MRTKTDCLCIELRHAANAVTKQYDAALAPAGLNITQLSQLHRIQTLEQPTLKSLAEATGLDRSTLGRNMRVMEAHGLVRIEDGEDARTRNIRLTHRGREAYQQGIPLWFGVQSALMDTLGDDGFAVLTAALETLSDSNIAEGDAANG